MANRPFTRLIRELIIYLSARGGPPLSRHLGAVAQGCRPLARRRLSSHSRGAQPPTRAGGADSPGHPNAAAVLGAPARHPNAVAALGAPAGRSGRRRKTAAWMTPVSLPRDEQHTRARGLGGRLGLRAQFIDDDRQNRDRRNGENRAHQPEERPADQQRDDDRDGADADAPLHDLRH